MRRVVVVLGAVVLAAVSLASGWALGRAAAPNATARASPSPSGDPCERWNQDRAALRDLMDDWSQVRAQIRFKPGTGQLVPVSGSGAMSLAALASIDARAEAMTVDESLDPARQLIGEAARERRLMIVDDLRREPTRLDEAAIELAAEPQALIRDAAGILDSATCPGS
jgi:hypothetical protein